MVNSSQSELNTSELLGSVQRCLDLSNTDLATALPLEWGALQLVRRHKGKIIIVTDRLVIKSHEINHPAAILISNERRIFHLLKGAWLSEVQAEGEMGGRHILVFKRAPGTDLFTGYVPSLSVPEIEARLLEALRHLHEQGVCHNDIRPYNVLWDIGSQRLTLIDFEFATERRYQGTDNVTQYFLSKAHDPKVRGYLEAQLEELGGEWRSEFGLGQPQNDLWAATKITAQLSQRGKYWQARLTRQAVRLLRPMVRWLRGN